VRSHLADTAGRSQRLPAKPRTRCWPPYGRWITNEGTLIDRAGLPGIDEIFTSLPADPERLAAAVEQAVTLINKPS
jgi:hypothetical protein